MLYKDVKEKLSVADYIYVDVTAAEIDSVSALDTVSNIFVITLDGKTVLGTHERIDALAAKELAPTVGMQFE